MAVSATPTTPINRFTLKFDNFECSFCRHKVKYSVNKNTSSMITATSCHHRYHEKCFSFYKYMHCPTCSKPKNPVQHYFLEKKCTICNKQFECKDEIVITYCRHLFHKNCIIDKFKEKLLHERTCNICDEIAVPLHHLNTGWNDNNTEVNAVIKREGETWNEQKQPLFEPACFQACRCNDLELLKKEYEADNDIATMKLQDLHDNRFYYLIQIAVQYSDKELFKYLLDIIKNNHSLIHKIFTDNNHTLFHLAINNNNYAVSIIQILCKFTHYFFTNSFADSLINKKNNQGCTPLHLAVAQTNKNVIDFLTKTNININALDNNNNSALHLALKKRNLRMVITLLKKHSDANLKYDGNGDTPLHRAIEQQDRNVTTILIEHGANIQYLFTAENSPINRVMEWKKPNKKIITLLINKGANINALFPDGDSPLSRAIKLHDNTLTTLFIENGANVHQLLPDGSTILQLSMKLRNEELAIRLIEQVSINTIFPEGDSIIHRAIELGFEELVVLLIKLHTDVNVLSPEGNSPLHIAIKKNMNYVAGQLIIVSNADNNALDKDKNSPLHLAISGNNELIVKMLIDENVNINILNKDNQSALQLVELQNNQTITRDVLKKHRHDRKRTHERANMPFLSQRCKENYFIDQLVKKQDTLTWSDLNLHKLSCVVNITDAHSLFDISEDMFGNILSSLGPSCRSLDSYVINSFTGCKTEIIYILLQAEHQKCCLVNWEKVASIFPENISDNKDKSEMEGEFYYNTNNKDLDKYIKSHTQLAAQKVDEKVCHIIAKYLKLPDDFTGKLELPVPEHAQKNNRREPTTYEVLNLGIHDNTFKIILALMNKTNNDNIASFLDKILKYSEYIYKEKLMDALLCLETETIDQMREKHKDDVFYVQLDNKKFVSDLDIITLSKQVDICHYYPFFDISHVLFTSITRRLFRSERRLNDELLLHLITKLGPRCYAKNIATALLQAEICGHTIDWKKKCF